MLDFIEKLKERPEEHRRAIAFGVSLGVTGLIFLIWVSVFFVKIKGEAVVVTKDDIETAKIAEQESPSPLESIRESAASIGEAVRSLRDIFDTTNSLQYKRE